MTIYKATVMEHEDGEMGKETFFTLKNEAIQFCKDKITEIESKWKTLETTLFEDSEYMLYAQLITSTDYAEEDSALITLSSHKLICQN